MTKHNQIRSEVTFITAEDCEKCKYCCSFKKSSLWGLPVINREEMENLKAIYSEIKFKKVKRNDCDGYIFDMENDYSGDDPLEEIPCPFNKNGCILGENKLFECAVWPFRAMKKNNDIVIAFCVDCPFFVKTDLQKIESLLKNGLGKKILDYAKKFPASVKDYKENYHVFGKNY